MSGTSYDTSNVPAGADTGVISGVNVVVTDENSNNEKTYVLKAVADEITTASTNFNNLVEDNLRQPRLRLRPLVLPLGTMRRTL